MITKLVTMLLICTTAWCRGQSGADDFGAKATPADLNISCRVNQTDRAAEVTILNRTEKRCYFVRSGSLTGYKVTATTLAGKPLPELTVEQALRQANPGSKYVNMFISSTMIPLGPKEKYTASFPLSDHILLPKEGGTFRVRIAQVLFMLPSQLTEPDPAETVWCKPIDVTFPPLK